MKAMAAAALLIWIGLSAELAWNPVLPHCSLTIPISCAVAFWFRNSVGIAFASLGLLLAWLIQPIGMPLSALIAPYLMAMLLTPHRSNAVYRQSVRLQRLVPPSTHLPLLVLTIIVIHHASSVPLNVADSFTVTAVGSWLNEVFEHVWNQSLLSVPIAAACSLFIVLADELGFRRSRHPFIAA